MKGSDTVGSKAAARFARVDAIFRERCRFEPVLEIGCGDGRVLAMLQAAGHRVVGVDIDPVALTAARARGLTDLVYARAEQLPFGDATFGSVVSGFFSANLIDPGALQAEAARVLQPGGTLTYTLLNPVIRTFDKLQWAVRHARLDPAALRRSWERLRDPAADQAGLATFGLVAHPLVGPAYLPILRRFGAFEVRSPLLAGRLTRFSWEVVVSGTKPLGLGHIHLNGLDQERVSTLGLGRGVTFAGGVRGPKHSSVVEPLLADTPIRIGASYLVAQPGRLVADTVTSAVRLNGAMAYCFQEGLPVWRDAIMGSVRAAPRGAGRSA